MLLTRHSANNGLESSEVGNFYCEKDTELQASPDEDDGQTQLHLADQLNVGQSTVSRRLQATGKILKTLLEFCLPGTNGSHFCIVLHENSIYFENPKQKALANRHNRLSSRIASERSHCFAFSGINVSLSGMSF